MNEDATDTRTAATAKDVSSLLTTALDLITAGHAVGVPLRLCGGLAGWFRSGETARRFAVAAGRSYSDFDLAAYYPDRNKVIELMNGAGFREASATATVPGIRRAIFSGPDALHGDVFFDAIDFCHYVDFRGRLEVDHPTLPLAELLLQKMQVVELTPKDVLDVQMLLFQFDFANSDEGAFSVPRIAGLCGTDWGFYRTMSINIDKMSAATESAAYLDEVQRTRVLDKFTCLRRVVNDAPKSLRWRLRAVVGDHVRWYETVEQAEVTQ